MAKTFLHQFFLDDMAKTFPPILFGPVLTLDLERNMPKKKTLCLLSALQKHDEYTSLVKKIDRAGELPCFH